MDWFMYVRLVVLITHVPCKVVMHVLLSFWTMMKIASDLLQFVP